MEALGRTGPLALNPVVYIPLPPRDAPEPDWHEEWKRVNALHNSALARVAALQQEALATRAQIVRLTQRAESAEQGEKELRAVLASRGQDKLTELAERLQLAERENAELRKRLDEPSVKPGTVIE
jgi:hypothetical protein